MRGGVSRDTLRLRHTRPYALVALPLSSRTHAGLALAHQHWPATYAITASAATCDAGLATGLKAGGPGVLKAQLALLLRPAKLASRKQAHFSYGECARGVSRPPERSIAARLGIA